MNIGTRTSVKNPLKSYTTVIFLNLAFAISLFGNELWVTLVFIAFINGLVYNYETTGVTINFPNNSHGIIFAFIELAGSLFAFVQIPITEQVKGKDSLMLKYLSTFVC